MFSNQQACNATEIVAVYASVRHHQVLALLKAVAVFPRSSVRGGRLNSPFRRSGHLLIRERSISPLSLSRQTSLLGRAETWQLFASQQIKLSTT